jgi:hypothetical protein
MPPRHNYWTILFGDKPTAFRAATQEELLPTFGQIKTRHPDAVMMWFARGKLWRSEEEARATFERNRERPSSFAKGDRVDRPRPRDDRPARDQRPPRPEWQSRDRSKTGDGPPRDFRGPKPPGAPKPRSGEGGEWRDKPRKDFHGPKPPWRDKPRDDSRAPEQRPPRPRGEWENRERPKTGDGPPRDFRGPKPPGAPKPRSGEGGDERRGRDWRPGGEHKDPRDRFKVPRDVKRARFKSQARRDRTNPRPPYKKKKDEE